MIYTKEFWKDTIERVLYTCVEVLLGAITGTSMITGLDWKVVIITTLTAGLVTLLKCVLKGLGDKDEHGR